MSTEQDIISYEIIKGTKVHKLNNKKVFCTDGINWHSMILENAAEYFYKFHTEIFNKEQDAITWLKAKEIVPVKEVKTKIRKSKEKKE